MCRLCIEKLDETKPAPKDLPGLRTTIDIASPPANVQTWQDFINWFYENPEILQAILKAILSLLGRIAPPAKPL